MITSYGARNCWAFKEWMVINFRINGNVPEEYGFKDVRVLPALCFEGANASGKSCSLRVLSFIFDFCRNSFNYRNDAPIMFDSFLIIMKWRISFCLSIWMVVLRRNIHMNVN